MVRAHGQRHLRLSFAFPELFGGMGEHATLREGLAHLSFDGTSGRALRVEQAFKPSDLVAQPETPLLQPPQQQFIDRDDLAQPVDSGIEVRVLNPEFDQLSGNGVKIGIQRGQCEIVATARLRPQLVSLDNTSSSSLQDNMKDRAIGATAAHNDPRLSTRRRHWSPQGNSPYQQDQVLILSHPRAQGCVLGVIADGMGGRSGGRKASDQVLMTARQLFSRYKPGRDGSLGPV